MNIVYESSLTHHGVKGMRWGVRRANKIAVSSAKKANRAVKDSVTNAKRAGKKGYTSIIEGKLIAEKHANDARREAYKALNASPKKHTRLQYEVTAARAARAARKKSIIEQKKAVRKARSESIAKGKQIVSSMKNRLVKDVLVKRSPKHD